MSNLGMRREVLFTYLTMRPNDDVAYELSNLVELIISCRSPIFTLFEQYTYLV